MPTILIGLSVIFFFSGMLVVAYTLQDTYNLVGECEPGGPGCEGITWQENMIRLGSALLFIGPVLALVGIVVHEKNKKPKPIGAEKQTKRPKKQ